MNPVEWASRHARFLVSLVTVLALAGAVTAWQLPVSLFPQVDFPRVRISLDAGDRPAERMAIEATIPVEEAVRAIPGVRGVRSNTTRGSAEVNVNFDWGEDMVAAMLQVESQINKVLSALPPGTTFNVLRMDPTVFPVIAYSLTSDHRPLQELRDLASYTVRPALATVPGVAQVGVQGGQTEEYRVVVDLPKLQALKLTITDVSAVLAAQNVLSAVGKLEESEKLYLVISDTRLKSFADLPKVVIASGSSGTLFLGDVATIERSTEPRWTRVTADAHDAVLFQVYQQPGGNTVQIAAGIKRKLSALGTSIPADVRVADWYDQGQLITSSATSTRDAVLIGIGLAILVLLGFLRDWRITAIAAVTVPAVLCSTILLLGVLKMSLNIMTLGGIAAAVGLIIDDAIVMAEHIVRRQQEGEGSSVLTAAREFSEPLLASSTATVIIFAPLAFLSGVTGAFFKALSLTMAASLILSLLISWLVLPAVAARCLHRGVRSRTHPQPHAGRLDRGYRRLAGFFVRRPAFILLICLPTAVLGIFAFQHVSSGFMPAMDEGGFILDYHSLPGTSLAETDRLLRQVEGILRKLPETQTYSRRTGLGLGGDLNETNSGDFFVRLRPLPRRGVEAVMDDVRQQIGQTIPSLQVETAQVMEDLIGDLTSVPQPIEIKLFSDDEQGLQTLAPKVAEAVSHVRGVVEVKNGITPAGDALSVEVDRRKAVLEGMDPDAITKVLTSYLSGDVATRVLQPPKLIGVRVWVPEHDRQITPQVERLLIRAPDGHLFPLARVAKLTATSGQPEIKREDLKRMVAVTARISGRDLGSTVTEVKRVLAQPGVVPATVPYALGGLYEQQQIAFQGLTVVLAAAVILTFLLLVFLYESFRVALAMLGIAFLAVAAVYVGLWLTGTEFNITSRMGMTMVVGIVTEVSIFYYSELREQSGPDRLIVAGLNRMRPIAMTTIAAILALAPLALGLGEGAAMLRPLAIAIISGLCFQLPLVLLVLPALLRAVRKE
ncbi:MAG TPA: efflux RND transporter permease subunit [Chthoniobacterales bacterium]